MSEQMEFYTLYFNPSDYPGKFVVRRWLVIPGVKEPVPDERLLSVGDTRELAEEVIPKGLFWMPRAENEDPVILGTYM